MTKNFDKFFRTLLEDMGVADVVGSDGPYDTGGDARVPCLLMPIQRRMPLKKNNRKPKKRK